MSAIVSAVTNAVTPEAPHVHHPAADQSVEFKGYAAYEKGGDVKPLAYNPHKLDDTFVEIAITHCGICASDVHVIDSCWFPTPYPIIPGHEIVGHVAAVGAGVKDLKVGDRVGVGAQCDACLECEQCNDGWENHCRVNNVWTYTATRKDGQVTQGGYADRYRCNSAFVFKIPEAISSAEAAPLMCGGVTTYAPLARHLTRPGMKVGIIGIGGLGHMGVMWASKLQNGTIDVTAISHNAKKRDEALKMGAHHFLDTSDAAALKTAAYTFDYLLCTANGAGQDYSNWLSLLKLGGTFCMVGAPEQPMPIPAFSLILTQVKVTGSGIGSIEEIKQMLDFADKHNIRPIIERLPMSQANEGIKRVRDGSVRFRVVLENPTA